MGILSGFSDDDDSIIPYFRVWPPLSISNTWEGGGDATGGGVFVRLRAPEPVVVFVAFAFVVVVVVVVVPSAAAAAVFFRRPLVPPPPAAAPGERRRFGAFAFGVFAFAAAPGAGEADLGALGMVKGDVTVLAQTIGSTQVSRSRFLMPSSSVANHTEVGEDPGTLLGRKARIHSILPCHSLPVNQKILVHFSAGVSAPKECRSTVFLITT